MSSGTLYRKYRSKTFAEVIGQEHITTTLENSIKNSSFAHAYLLTGPRGVGKTSVARLFAYAINNISYEDGGQTYSDIIEIDAASNRRIDEIRELREKVAIAPSALKYKVYIIDEVHMLTKEAFNALLKTLEEPPEYVVFVLATTDFHKVPDTITSRCVRFAFSSITKESIKKHLTGIANKEKIDIDPEALDIIADNSDGSFRDAISLLDQFKNSGKKIKADYVAKVLGLSPKKEIAALIKHVENSQAKKIVESLAGLKQGGANDDQIVKQLINYLRLCLLNEEKTVLDRPTILSLIENLLKIDSYSNTALATEIILIEACKYEQPAKNDSIKISAQDKTDDIILDPQKTKTTKPAKAVPKDDFWQSVLENLKENNNTLYAIARMADAKIDGDSLELYFKFPFHYKQMKLEKNFLQMEKSVKSLDSKIAKLTIHLNASGEAPESSEDSINSISNIFGPSEVLES